MYDGADPIALKDWVPIIATGAAFVAAAIPICWQIIKSFGDFQSTNYKNIAAATNGR